MGKFLSSFTSNNSLMGERHYKLYSAMRELTCKNFLSLIEDIEVKKGNFSEFKRRYIEEWTGKAKKLIFHKDY